MTKLEEFEQHQEDDDSFFQPHRFVVGWKDKNVVIWSHDFEEKIEIHLTYIHHLNQIVEFWFWPKIVFQLMQEGL